MLLLLYSVTPVPVTGAPPEPVRIFKRLSSLRCKVRLSPSEIEGVAPIPVPETFWYVETTDALTL